MTTFGKKGMSQSTLAARGTRAAYIQTVHATSDAAPKVSVVAEGSETTLRTLKRLSMWSLGIYLLMICGFGLAMAISPFYWLSQWSELPGQPHVTYAVFGFGLLLFFVNLAISVILGIHQSRNPTGMQLHMRRNPSIYLIGPALGLAAFAIFSEHSFQSLFTDFSISKVLLLNGTSSRERQPWSEFLSYIGLGLLATAALSYWKSKLLDGGEGTS